MPVINKPTADTPFVILEKEGNEILTSLDSDLVKKLYKKYGAILFRGFDLNVSSFANMAQKYCTHAAHNQSKGRDLVDKDRLIQSVNLGTEPFPLHPEMSAQPWKPDICWFGCIEPPVSGGETTLCDGVEIFKNLPEDMREHLLKKKIKYVFPSNMNDIRYWMKTDKITAKSFERMPKDCPFTFFQMQNGLYSSYVTDFFHKTMFSQEHAFGNFLLFARYLNNRMNYPLFEDNSIIPVEISETIKKVSDELIAPIPWQKGDLVMADNTRFLHGRNEVIKEDERYILTYFGYINFAKLTPTQKKARWRKEKEDFFQRRLVKIG